VITGIAVDRTGSFSAGFVIAAAVALVGIVAYGVIVAGSSNRLAVSDTFAEVTAAK